MGDRSRGGRRIRLAGVEGVSSRRCEMTEGVGMEMCVGGETVDTGAGSGWDWVMVKGTGMAESSALTSVIGSCDSEFVCVPGFAHDVASPGETVSEFDPSAQTLPDTSSSTSCSSVGAGTNDSSLGESGRASAFDCLQQEQIYHTCN